MSEWDGRFGRGHTTTPRAGAEKPSSPNQSDDTGDWDEPLLQFFSREHLPPAPKSASRMFRELAVELVVTLPRNVERTEALRKLREAADCAERARLMR